jgi:chloride channel protein, CIC family
VDSPPSQAPRARRGRTLALMLVAPGVVGAVTGACVAIAATLVEGEALSRLAALPGLLPAACTPLALLVTLAVAVGITRVAHPSTAELYIETYHDPQGRIPLRQLPGRVLAAATTVGFGGAQGLESPSALIGAGTGDVLAHGPWWRLDPAESRALMVAGASAGIAAVFSSPALGTFYGMEVPFRRDLDARPFVPCAVAAAMSYVTRDALVGVRHLVEPGAATPPVDLVFVTAILLVGLGCGAGARLFAHVDTWLQHRARHRSRLARAVSAGVALAGLAWAGHALTREWVTFGPGYLAVGWLLAGSHPAWLVALVLAVRASATLTCVYGGGGGGVFTALATCGAFIGQLVAMLVHDPTRVYPLLGAACFLGAGYRLPVGTAMLVAESSGDIGVAAAGLVAIAIAQACMGEESVSEAKTDTRAPHRTAVRDGAAGARV